MDERCRWFGSLLLPLFYPYLSNDVIMPVKIVPIHKQEKVAHESY
ncbi:MAG TPA: hypothetical protein VF553_13475 [Pyrinomonadaceae bacterium]